MEWKGETGKGDSETEQETVGKGEGRGERVRRLQDYRWVGRER